MKSYFFYTDQLTVGYDGKPLIKEINIQLNKGEILTLIGPNGAGKSTILKSITRQLSLISGTIYLEHEQMSRMTNREVSKKLAVVLTERMRPELMTLNMHDEEALSQAIRWADVIAIGPGLSKSPEAVAVLHSLDGVRKPIIADADALNLIASGEIIQTERLIITPHPAEAGRLLGMSASEVNQDRFAAALKLHQRLGGVVLLKGAGTVICDGKKFTIISEGSPAMAAGGMGDLLTGMIAALLAQGLSMNLAAVCAAIIHGRAGTLSAMQNGIIGTLPLDLCPYIRKLVNGIVDFKS